VLSKGRIIAVLDLPVSITENLSGNNRQRITTLSESEEGLIRKTLEECDWNKSKAAEKIGISRGTLYQKIRKYRIRN
jgi:transcriptional regulator of acetoin/glycerol metabolism